MHTNDKGPLWRAREREGMTRAQVVAILDPPVSPKTLERWERETTPVPYQRLRQLALVYRTKPSELVG